MDNTMEMDDTMINPMNRYEVDLEIVVSSKKRGFISTFEKQETIVKTVNVMAEDQDQAEKIAIGRFVIKDPRYTLVSARVSDSEELVYSDYYTVSVSGKIYFTGEETEEMTHEFIYARNSEISEETLKQHGEVEFRKKVQELEGFKEIKEIKSFIFPNSIELVAQI